MRNPIDQYIKLMVLAGLLFSLPLVTRPDDQQVMANPFGAAICSAKSARMEAIRVAETTSLSDGEIAYIYIQANLFEVEKAELGKKLGTSADVRAHGEMVAADHRGVIKSFEELLKMNHIRPVETAGSAASIAGHQAVMASLKALSGSEFDRAYLVHEVENHRAVIGAIRTVLLPSLKNAALTTHMKSVLPAFEYHLAMTEDAVKKAGIVKAQ